MSIHQNGAISHGKRPAPQYSTPRRAGLPVSAMAREICAYSISSEKSHGVGCFDACQTYRLATTRNEKSSGQDVEQAVAERLGAAAGSTVGHDAVTVLPRLRQERNDLQPGPLCEPPGDEEDEADRGVEDEDLGREVEECLRVGHEEIGDDLRQRRPPPRCRARVPRLAALRSRR